MSVVMRGMMASHVSLFVASADLMRVACHFGQVKACNIWPRCLHSIGYRLHFQCLCDLNMYCCTQISWGTTHARHAAR